MSKERGSFFKEMTWEKAALIFVGTLIIAGVSIGLINEALAITAA